MHLTLWDEEHTVAGRRGECARMAWKGLEGVWGWRGGWDARLMGAGAMGQRQCIYWSGKKLTVGAGRGRGRNEVPDRVIVTGFYISLPSPTSNNDLANLPTPQTFSFPAGQNHPLIYSFNHKSFFNYSSFRSLKSWRIKKKHISAMKVVIEYRSLIWKQTEQEKCKSVLLVSD